MTADATMCGGPPWPANRPDMQEERGTKCHPCRASSPRLIASVPSIRIGESGVHQGPISMVASQAGAMRSAGGYREKMRRRGRHGSSMI